MSKLKGRFFMESKTGVRFQVDGVVDVEGGGRVVTLATETGNTKHVDFEVFAIEYEYLEPMVTVFFTVRESDKDFMSAIEEFAETWGVDFEIDCAEEDGPHLTVVEG